MNYVLKFIIEVYKSSNPSLHVLEDLYFWLWENKHKTQNHLQMPSVQRIFIVFLYVPAKIARRYYELK